MAEGTPKLKVFMSWIPSKSQPMTRYYTIKLKKIIAKKSSEEHLRKERLAVLVTGSSRAELGLSPYMEYNTVASKIDILLRDWYVTSAKVKDLIDDTHKMMKALKKTIGFLEDFQDDLDSVYDIIFHKSDFITFMKVNEQRHKRYDRLLDRCKQQSMNELAVERKADKKKRRKRRRFKEKKTARTTQFELTIKDELDNLFEPEPKRNTR